MGNIAAAPLDVATFYYNLLAEQSANPIVSADSRRQMLHFLPFSNHSWGAFTGYGLGLMNMSSMGEQLMNVVGSTCDLVGHGGEDWGSAALFSGYSHPFQM